MPKSPKALVLFRYSIPLTRNVELFLNERHKRQLNRYKGRLTYFIFCRVQAKCVTDFAKAQSLNLSVKRKLELDAHIYFPKVFAFG